MRAARTDANHKEVVAAFRKFGCSVLQLHMVGAGCPDLCIGLNKKSILVEVKDGNKVKSARALTKDDFTMNGKGVYLWLKILET